MLLIRLREMSCLEKAIKLDERIEEMRRARLHTEHLREKKAS
jgi:hypothetical protein